MSQPTLKEEYIPNLLKKYRQEIVPKLMQKFGYKNPLQVPRLVKVVVNMGCGEAAHDSSILDQLMRDLALITGQKPKVCRARKPISNFKIKRGSPVGLKVTLRRKMMYEFLERLLTFAIPRIKDFRGLNPNSFDNAGNYSFGISEHTIFCELDLDKVKHVQGMDINVVTTAKTKEEARALLEELGFPFKKR